MQGRVVGQEHVGFEGTVPGESDIHSVNSVGVEVSPVQQRGDDYLAGCSMTLLRESASLSCWDLKSLVPVWMMMRLGEPSSGTVNSSRALLVLGHQVFSVLCLGNKVFSSRNFPLESMRRIMSALLPVCVCSDSAVGSGCGAVVVVSGLELLAGGWLEAGPWTGAGV